MMDITIGQFFPGKSIMHKIDPRLKICLTIFSIVLLFMAQNFLSLAVAVAFIFIGMLISKVPVKLYLKSIRAVIFIVVFTSLLNVFYGTGEPIAQFWVFKVTVNGILNSVFISTRIISLILASSVLTFTTSPTQLTDAIERLLKPLTYIKVPVHEFAMIMTIALRFVPLLLEETDKIMQAQKARGADMESGGMVQRIKAMIPVLIPLFVSAFRRAYDLATAMESRCYHGGEGRTKMKILKMQKSDFFVILLVLILLVVFLLSNRIFPPVFMM
ncbi:energy-coupling factor transporter transmembrane component T family protein [Scatolibacter rhodanostii]|uniref:energy-coupling factor transporter transmembrane component T family protein n=1 Tax=Scatolibacter rhodanostii TaxID=2014781 RepID=UPI000C0721D8|nr:energy-coupling factor transporter transmembrane component T [Scatolibacter rhodanostii]